MRETCDTTRVPPIPCATAHERQFMGLRVGTLLPSSSLGSWVAGRAARGGRCGGLERRPVMYAGAAMVKQTTQSQRAGGAKPADVTAKRREELRTLIEWRAPALRELEKH